MKYFIGILLVLIIGFTACKKEAKTVVPIGKTELEFTIELIRHKWTFDKFIHLETLNAQTFADTVVGVPGDYFEFGSNNIVYSLWDNVHDTIPYYVYVKTHLRYGGDTFNIATLNTTRLVLINTSATDTSSIYNEIRLKK